MKENFDLPIELKNGYIIIKDIVNEKTSSGIYIPDDKYNRFARVLKVGENSKLKPGDVVIKPIGRTTPIKLNGVIYDCIKESFIFAKIEE
jgi:co-chaperonin GroES (HSP10)